jgi:hypothetical protein
MREVDAGLLERAAARQHPRHPSAPSRSSPSILAKPTSFVLFLQGLAGSILKAREIRVNRIGIGSDPTRPYRSDHAS